MNWLTPVLQKEIKPDWTVLDLGCGLMVPTDGLRCKVLLGVDCYRPYLERLKDKHVVIQGDLKYCTANFLDRSFDAVLLLEVVEHLELRDARRLIEEAERIARRKVIIYTPSEENWTPQDLDERGLDAWGFPNPHQRHRCRVSRTELERRGYRVKKIPPDYNLLAVKRVG